MFLFYFLLITVLVSAHPEEAIWLAVFLVASRLSRRR